MHLGIRTGLVTAERRHQPGYSHQGLKFSDYAPELRKHPLVTPGARTLRVWTTSNVSAGQP